MRKDVVCKLGIKREPGWLYFLRGTDVMRAPMKRVSIGSTKAEKVAAATFIREDGYLYFLDANGDVSRVARGIGRKRKLVRPNQENDHA